MVGYGPLKSEDVLAFNTRAEFGRQIYNLLAKGYPRVAGLTSTEFLAHVYPLLGRVTELQSSAGARARQSRSSSSSRATSLLGPRRSASWNVARRQRCQSWTPTTSTASSRSTA